MRIITISREFGSGGREIGALLAKELGVSYYDREIIDEVAKRASSSADYVEQAIQKGELVHIPIAFHHTFAFVPFQPTPTAELLAERHRVVHELGSKGDCVIVGRSADSILEEFHPLNLFVYADMESKLRRCRERAKPDEDVSDKALTKKIREIDKMRASYHDMISSTRWGERSGYHLCINTSGLEIPALVKALLPIVQLHFQKKQ